MRTYKVVDAFSNRPFLGNPVAVVLDAEGLSDAEMQAIARWTNLSETTFLLPATAPGADYRLRIFTPRSELPFAGHPTLGSAHAIIEAGRFTPRDGLLVQECGAGLVKIAVEGQGADRTLTLSLPPARSRTLSGDEVAELEAILGQPVLKDDAPALINVGPAWVVAELENAETVLGLKPDFARSAVFEKKLGATGLTVFGKHRGGEAEIEVRSFAPSCGVEEDPVCGSGNGSVAVFRSSHRMPSAEGFSYVASQGQQVGRDGRIFIAVDDRGGVTVGGKCVTCVEGQLVY
ncbi:PhzF family phenazine biosynthesis protein [Sinorhizobium sp. BG8]|uniref:PhzF family phenazine biosynthesis protein n=1 Tax=Sinorhizobium sp. BG8 TaxID=2613773 RepID=UPI00193D5AB0|nr:PhzF family phenazine biosynthesis protein [Sinorhizobium sp. BG8]